MAIWQLTLPYVSIELLKEATLIFPDKVQYPLLRIFISSKNYASVNNENMVQCYRDVKNVLVIKLF